MAFRFQRRIKILPKVRLNVSKSGVSTSFGGRGLSTTIGKKGAHLNVGLPGTGLAYRTRIASGASGSSVNSNEVQSAEILTRSLNAVSKALYIIAVVILLLIIGVFNSLNIVASTITNICILLILALVVIRLLSKAHKAKPLIKEAEGYCQEYMYEEAINLLQQAYTIYPNELIKQDIEDLTNYIENNNLNNE